MFLFKGLGGPTLFTLSLGEGYDKVLAANATNYGLPYWGGWLCSFYFYVFSCQYVMEITVDKYMCLYSSKSSNMAHTLHTIAYPTKSTTYEQPDCTSSMYLNIVIMQIIYALLYSRLHNLLL